MLYELSKTADAMKWYRDLIPSAPDDLNGFFAFLTVSPAPPFPEHLHMKKMCGVVWAYAWTTGESRKTVVTNSCFSCYEVPASGYAVSWRMSSRRARRPS